MAKLDTSKERDTSAEAIRQRHELARKALSDLCKDPQRNFRMTIPVQDDDTDILISESLRDIPLMLEKLKELVD